MLRILPNESCKLPPASVYYTGASNNLALWVARRASSAHVLVSQSQHDAGSSCCGDCEDLIALESWTYHRDATKCVCFSGEASDVSGIFLSNYDDCLHITGDGILDLDYTQIVGGDGNDVIVITGGDIDYTYIYGGDGDDVITLTGDHNEYIDGGDGDDTIIIYGDDNDEIYGGPGRDSCSIVSSDGGVTPVDGCETAAPPAPTAVPTAQATP